MEDETAKRPREQQTARKFLHHLHDTLVLLGAPAKLAELVEGPESIRPSHVDALRRYNIRLLEAAKDKLTNVNKIAISVGKARTATGNGQASG